MPTINEIAPESVFTIELNAGTPGIQGPQGPQGVQGPVGPEGKIGPKPIRGVDYFTQQDINNMVSTITSSSNSAFNENVANRTREFNSNVSMKTNVFDNNALLKTEDFNTNAKTKKTDFNLNANDRTTEFNTNASDKKKTFDDNANEKQNLLDTHIANKTTVFDKHVEDKISEFKEETSEYITENELESKGYLVENDLNGYAKEEDLFSGSYNDLKDKPNIPSKVSELTNDKSFINEIPSEYVTEEEQNEFIKPYNNRITSNEKDIVDLEATIDILTNTDTKKGELVHITDALPLPVFETKASGNVKQETTEGKNLFNPNKPTLTLNGITLTNNGDGTYTVSGTSTKATGISLTTSNIVLENGKTYTQSVIVTSGELKGSVVPSFKNSAGEITYNFFINNSKNTPTDTMTLHNYDYYIAEATTVNFTFKVQLELGATATEWEEYSGGQASPNSEYPQEIEVLEAYNEFDISKVLSNSPTLINNGDTLTITTPNNNASVRPTAPYTLKDFCPNLKVGKTYNLNANTTGTFKYIYLDIPANSWSFGTTRTITQDDLDSPVRFYASGTGTTATISNIIISKENRPYVPSGCVGIKNAGKNLFDKNNANILKLIPSGGSNMHFVSSSTNASIFIPIKGGKKYTVSRQVLSNRFSVATSENIPVLSGSLIEITSLNSASSLTINTSDNANYLCVYLTNDGTNFNEVLQGLQIEEGLTATDYVIFQEQIVPPDLKGNWIGKLSDSIKDYLVTDKKKYWLVKNVGKVVLDGSSDELWSFDGSLTNTSRFALANSSVGISVPSSYQPSICNYFINDNEGNTYNRDTEHYYIGSSNSFFFVKNTIAQDINDFKIFLSENKPEVYYPLATPKIIVLGELPETIKTFEGTNNIQVLANLDTEIEVTYALDVKKYFENKLASIQEQIL